MTQTVISMKWGTRYGADYANRLYSMVKRNTQRPTRFVCYTDSTDGLDPGIEAVPLPAITLPERVRWKPWRKVSLWQAAPEGIAGDVLFLDLDLVVTGPLDDFFDYEPEGTFLVIRNWTQPGSGIGNTSCYRFRVGAHTYLYETMMADAEAVLARFPNSQTYISRSVRTIAYWPDEWCQSFKHTLMPVWPLNFFQTPRLKPGTRVVAFTGKPDPDEARDGRWPAPWHKRVYKYVRPTPWIAEHWR